ncbi:MAG: M13 family metallopeptidase [Cystobacter sp.]
MQYLKQEELLASVRTSYREYLAKLSTLAGESDAAAVVAFETELARAHWPLADTRDAAKTYNKWSLADFETNAPGFPWRAYVASLDMARQSAYLALHPSAFTGEALAFAATPLPVLKDYLTLRMLNNYARFLSSPFEEARFSFRSRVLNGATERPPRARFAVTLVNQCLGDTVGRIYVARHFSPRARAEAEAMVRRVIAAMDERLARLEWMAPETKAKAREKLARVRVKIGYPKRWRDDSALEVKPDDLVGNVARASAWEYRRRLDRLGKPADPEEWLSPATGVNAFDREPALRSQLLSAPHAPGRERVLTVRNLDAWYDVYGVAPGQTLYLPPEGRVRIW